MPEVIALVALAVIAIKNIYDFVELFVSGDKKNTAKDSVHSGK